MNTYNIFPSDGGAPHHGPQPGHRPKRRRKNRDARKKDAEKKKEKEGEAKTLAFRKALFWTTLVSPILVPILGVSLYGIIKLVINILSLTAQMLGAVIK